MLEVTMRHSSYKTKPVSRIDLRNFVFALRSIMKYQDTTEIDVIRIFENDLYEIFGEDYRYEVVEVDQMNEYAIYLPDLNKIVVRADVYEAAASGNPRHRFTIAHEIGHFFLHRDVTKLARIDGKLPQLKPYEDPE
ncbi:MAG: ImmA/IrrE family metallo-endopeptidase, partial [Exiguobacterium chiriqhucha]